jgi:hypothetical protein
MNVEIGQKVKISKDTAGDLKWYNDETYTIVCIDKPFLILDKLIPIKQSNKIHEIYLMSLSELRRNKLEQLNNLI